MIGYGDIGVAGGRSSAQFTSPGLTDPDGETRCMTDTGMTASHPGNLELVRDLGAARGSLVALLADKLTRGALLVQVYCGCDAERGHTGALSLRR